MPEGVGEGCAMVSFDGLESKGTCKLLRNGSASRGRPCVPTL